MGRKSNQHNAKANEDEIAASHDNRSLTPQMKQFTSVRQLSGLMEGRRLEGERTIRNVRGPR
jgi:hypothetical protein